jgi:predicted AAA+ superfamily ATPase
MHPVANPYVPAAGAQPPELVGRDGLRNRIGVATARLLAGRFAKSMVLVGLRGVGKTVLLDRMRQDATLLGIQTLRIEAPEGRSLPAILAPQLRLALLH